MFGLSAAVVNFNRLPEMMTAICRRVGFSPSWHFFDDQGTLDFEETSPNNRHGEDIGMAASEFVGYVYNRIGRPFKQAKHLPPCPTKVHLGLKNELKDFHSNKILLEPKPGNLQEILDIINLYRSREDQKVSRERS